ncbi:hypothetical protein ES703_125283 [subsurface metagenome]
MIQSHFGHITITMSGVANVAILKNPLFSDEARGQVAKVAIFKRAEVHPVFCGFFYHPVRWTALKRAQAQAWKSLCNQWRALSYTDQENWRDIAPGVLTGFNYFMHLKGAFPFPPCYEPPAGNCLFFDFIDDTYSPPAGNSLNFEWEECI